jgi:hypothetical protein
MLFTNGTENKIGALFRNEIIFCLGAFQKAFANEATAPNGNF